MKEILWIHNFQAEINGKPIPDPILLRADNQGTIQLLNNNKFHMCMKHIDVRYHCIQEALENKLLEIKYVPTDENIVGIFTKPLSSFEKFRGMLGLCYAWGGVLRLGQARIYSTNIFPITFFYFLLYPTIDSALASHYLGYSFMYYGLIFLLEAEMYVNHLPTLLDTKLTVF